MVNSHFYRMYTVSLLEPLQHSGKMANLWGQELSRNGFDWMNFVTKRQLAISALFFNLVSIGVLTKWRIGWFHLNQSGTISAVLCLGWCVVALGLVMFQHGEETSENIGSFRYRSLSEWEKFGVAIVFIADVFLANTVIIGFFIIFFMIYWIVTFRIGHRHISGEAGYQIVGSMLWVNLISIWTLFAV